MKQSSISKHRILAIGLGSIALLLLVASTLWAEEEEARKPLGFFDVWQLPRVWIGAIFCLIGLALLIKTRISRNLRLLFLVVIFFTFSVLAILPLGKFAWGMGLHPSPMCSITKPFLFVNAGRSIPIIFFAILASIAILSIIGNKLFCGWVCPVGAAQEITHRIRLPEKFEINLPFRITNTIRAIIFVAFVPLVFWTGKELYEYFNPFEFLHWGFQLYVTIVFAVTLIAALLIFRPFCYLICPIGLFSWLLEHLSLAKVKVDKDTPVRNAISASTTATVLPSNRFWMKKHRVPIATLAVVVWRYAPKAL